MPGVSELGAVVASMRSQTPPVSYRQIAAQLGISLGKVQRELAQFNLQAAGGPVSVGPQPITFDPDVADSRRRLEMGRLGLAQQRLELDRMELEQRMEILKAASAGKGGESGPMFALLLGEINRLRESMARGPAGGAGGGLIDELSRFREVGEIVKTMAPPPAMSGREGVEFSIALERIRQENERILRERQAELDNRRLEIEGQSARDHALAKLIEGLAPVAAQAAEKWIATQSPAPAPAVQLEPPAAAAAAAAGAAGLGHCPRCSYPPGDQEMELVPTGSDVCPGCAAPLTVADGRIVLAGQAAPAAAAAVAAPTSSNGHAAGPQLPSFTS